LFGLSTVLDSRRTVNVVPLRRVSSSGPHLFSSLEACLVAWPSIEVAKGFSSFCSAHEHTHSSVGSFSCSALLISEYRLKDNAWTNISISILRSESEEIPKSVRSRFVVVLGFSKKIIFGKVRKSLRGKCVLGCFGMFEENAVWDFCCQGNIGSQTPDPGPEGLQPCSPDGVATHSSRWCGEPAARMPRGSSYICLAAKIRFEIQF
jgi:hypothetical protein